MSFNETRCGRFDLSDDIAYMWSVTYSSTPAPRAADRYDELRLSTRTDDLGFWVGGFLHGWKWSLSGYVCPAVSRNAWLRAMAAS